MVTEKVVARINHKKPAQRLPLFIELYDGPRYVGAVCYSVTQQRWAATWNLMFPDDDPKYCHADKQAAITEVLQRATVAS